MEPVELEGIAHNIGPFELYSLSREERRALLSRNSQPTQQNMIPPHRLIIETLFGNQLCSPQYLGLRRVYMAQIDHKLKTALYESAVANPNPAVWPKPFAYLVGFLGILSQQLTPSASVTTFILSHMNDFAAMIRNGNFSAPQMQDGTSDGEKAAMAIAMGFNDPDNYTPWHQKIVHEWMLFSLEAWTMLNLSRSIECRTNLTASQTFCESTIEELIKPHLPAHALPAYTVAGVSPVSITPSEVTASMLHDWKGVTLKWTTDITEHLRLDSHDKVVKLYANVAFCHLHSIAKEKSSLYKAGFVRHHSLLAEISESYRLLFGSDRRSQTYFLELEASNPCNGFFNIFTLPNCDYEPRFLYSVTNDFPVFGDRLLVLKKLCVPTGILGLWRDKRDSLQWYTFWAVVFLGCFGAIMAFLQLGLTAIQTWATVAAMNPKPN
ncbi:hypothetical protein K440DRAFT_426415 [Wilcoxina mikolae CBS 423.85]|nr:hypothetical protein K440DRAFT_426415 [Wilcoxina mikolae CBS 423.85]